MNKNNNRQSEHSEGLPDVAQRAKAHKAIILLMVAIVVVTFLGVYIKKKSHQKPSEPAEETYTIQNENLNENKTDIVKTNKQVINHSEASKKPEIERHEITQEQIAFIREKQKELQQRLSAPLMVVNNSASIPKVEDDAVKTQGGLRDANSKFMDQVTNEKHGTANASTIGPLNSVIAEGGLLHAILENATNSDLPGFLRAVISEPAYSEDGTQVLIPRGSRLIGQYKSGMQQGQSRIFIVWTRLITPTGISITLSSAGVDSLGVSGIGADAIDRHFWDRFGTASLLSIIGTGAANLGVSSFDRENSASTYRSALANSFAQSADQSLQQQNNISPTLKTYQGRPIMVFVARDLNFESVKNQENSKINIL